MSAENVSEESIPDKYNEENGEISSKRENTKVISNDVYYGEIINVLRAVT